MQSEPQIFIRSFKKYLWAVSRHWYALVAGFAGGIVGVIQMWAPNMIVPSWACLLIFFLGIFAAQFLAWHEIRQERDKYKRMLKPKLKVLCGRNIEGCHQKTNFSVNVGGGDVIYFRLFVKNIGATLLKNCNAVLVGMEKDGVSLKYSEVTQLMWGNTENQAHIDIGGGMHRFLDVICAIPDSSVPKPKGTDEIFMDAIDSAHSKDRAYVITKDNGQGFIVPKSVAQHHKFREFGEYKLKIQIGFDSGPAITKVLIFNWTGKWDTAEATCQ